MQFTDHRRFADAGIAGYQHQCRRACLHHIGEGIDQRLHFVFAAVEFFRNQQALAGALLVQRERLDLPHTAPVIEATAQVMLDTGCALIAFLGRFRQQFHDQSREHRRHRRHPFTHGHWQPRDMAMHPLRRVICTERQRAGEHLVKRHAKGIQITTRIDRTIHPPGLFRRHVGQRPGDRFRWRGRLPLPWQARGQAEAGQPRLPIMTMDKNMLRFQVFVHQTTLMHMAQCLGDVRGQFQTGFDIQRGDQQPRQRLAARIVEQQTNSGARTLENCRLQRPGRIEVVPEAVFMRQTLQGARQWLAHRRTHRQ